MSVDDNVRTGIWVGVIFGFFAALWAGLWWLSPYYFGTNVANWMRTSTPFWLMVWPFVFMILLFIVAAYLFSEVGKAAGAIVTFLAFAMLLPFTYEVRQLNRSSYDAVSWYSANLAEVKDAHPVYQTRLNIPQARVTMERSTTGITGTMSDVTYIGNAYTPMYCAQMVRDAQLGREWVKNIICLDTATGKVQTVNVGDNAHIGVDSGAWSSRLGAQIARIQRGLAFDAQDVYSYIDKDGKGYVVVPVTQISGFGHSPHSEPAGVVVFDADTGHTHWHKTLKPGEIPGPVMPISIAAQAREAVNTKDGFVRFQKTGRNPNALKPASNGSNDSEFTLLRADGRLVYVTPMTPARAGGNVTAYVEVLADEVQAHTPPTGTVYRLPNREASTNSIADRIRTLYDADVDWNVIHFYEVTPGGPGEMVATAGQGDQTLYRFRIQSTLQDNNQFGQICVYRYRDDQKIRCDSAAGDPTSIGALRGVVSGTGDQPETPSPATAAPAPATGLETATDAQLLAELQKRMAAAAK